MVVEVEIVDVAGEPGPESDRHLRLEELDHGIGVRRDTTKATPLHKPPGETLAIPGDKIPDELKFILSDENTLTTLTSGSGATVAVASIWGRVKDIASSKAGFDEKSMKELKELVQSKLQEAKKQAGEQGSASLDAAWKAAESWLKTVPGGQKALDAVPDVSTYVVTLTNRC